jgi:alkaline phosphatase D
MLGKEQWTWLESELRRPAEVRLLISSIQAISAEHGWEKWANMPAERSRLFGLIRETGAEGVLLFSGDRHLGEVSALPVDDPDGVGYPLFELTSAGLTHGTDLPFEPNRYRVASEDIFRQPNFGILNIDWSAADPRLLLQVVNAEGETVIEQALTLGQLRVDSGVR